jgi:hypothetical protein
VVAEEGVVRSWHWSLFQINVHGPAPIHFVHWSERWGHDRMSPTLAVRIVE